MKIVVCIRQGLDGEINPFDACAYEEALRIENSEITLLSMGPQTAKDFLYKLTRLGAKRAVLLSSKAFAGADTLATAYTLSKAIEKLAPDLVLCGRQTLVGDTAQTAPMLSALLNYNVITNVMKINVEGESVTCTTRYEGDITTQMPAVLTVERINSLRLPRLRSPLGEIEVLNETDIGANADKTGLKGSPTRVLETKENASGRRKCKFISREELPDVIKEALAKSQKAVVGESAGEKLKSIAIVGEAPMNFAKTVCDNITVLPLSDEAELINAIKSGDFSAVLWGSDSKSKRLAARAAAKLGLGLCADCTLLEARDDTLIMYRPALSGSIIAKIKSLTRPAMATVRTTDSGVRDIIVGLGFGVRDKITEVTAFANQIGADIAASRKMVDNDLLSYDIQVGLTGKTVSPPIYIAIGISGAVHHIVGMERAGTVIAINPDKNAPIFDYADYGILSEF